MMNDHMAKIRFLLVTGLLLFLSGCPALLTAITAASQGAQWLSSAIDVADAGQDAFFARHPSPEREPAVAAAIRKARVSAAALDAVLSAGEAAAEGDLEKAKAAALQDYDKLRALLAEMGVLEAIAPEGGAETEAPMPEPFELPTREQIEQRMGSGQSP